MHFKFSLKSAHKCFQYVFFFLLPFILLLRIITIFQVIVNDNKIIKTNTEREDTEERGNSRRILTNNMFKTRESEGFLKIQINGHFIDEKQKISIISSFKFLISSIPKWYSCELLNRMLFL